MIVTRRASDTGALRLIDWIWTVRGALPLGPGQSAQAALTRIEALLHEPGTRFEREGMRLQFRKVDPASQDKLAVFERGQLEVAGDSLHYALTSRALLFCFLAPGFFLGVAALIESSRNSGRVFAALFAALYLVGRWLEPRLAARLFAQRLAGIEGAPLPDVPDIEGTGAT
jgi:hypothetical protein